MTDLTNTAPKRIYLDIGDQFALERVASGSLRWDLLEGVTWSEDNATGHGIPYVRADLVPTPAASGAAPLTDERIGELWIEHGLDECAPEGFARIIEREVLAALASPQVAPEATEAQKALRAVLAWAKGYIRTNSRVIDDWRDDMHRIIERAERGLATPAPAAPQDDARDAAEVLTSEQELAPITKEEWKAAAEAVFRKDGASEEEAKECARYAARDQDWLSGDVDDPAMAAQEFLAEMGPPPSNWRARDAIRREAFEQAAKEPRAYAEMLEKGGWGNRFPDELCAIFNASTNMAERIRALADAPAAKPTEEQA